MSSLSYTPVNIIRSTALLMHCAPRIPKTRHQILHTQPPRSYINNPMAPVSNAYSPPVPRGKNARSNHTATRANAVNQKPIRPWAEAIHLPSLPYSNPPPSFLPFPHPTLPPHSIPPLIRAATRYLIRKIPFLPPPHHQAVTAPPCGDLSP